MKIKCNQIIFTQIIIIRYEIGSSHLGSELKTERVIKMIISSSKIIFASQSKLGNGKYFERVESFEVFLSEKLFHQIAIEDESHFNGK